MVYPPYVGLMIIILVPLTIFVLRKVIEGFFDDDKKL